MFLMSKCSIKNIFATRCNKLVFPPPHFLVNVFQMQQNEISIAIKRFTQTMCKTRKVSLCATEFIEAMVV